MPNMKKAYPTTATGERPRGGILLDFARLHEMGLNVELDRDQQWLHISGSSILNQEALAHAEAFGEALRLNPGEIDQLIETGVTMSLWAHIRRVTMP